MPSKADILNKYAKKHKVRPSLLSKVFQIERARLRSGESEKQYRQEEILKILEEEAERPDQK